MRFQDGFWLNKKGFEINYAAFTHDITPVQNGFRVLTTPFEIKQRGQMLGSANLEIEFTSDAENCIKVRVTHHRGFVRKTPDFDLNKGSYAPTVKIGEDEAVLISGDTRAVISKKDWKVSYYYKNKLLTSAGWRSSAVIFESEARAEARQVSHREDRFWDCVYDSRTTYIREQLNAAPGEYFYGFGEKFTSFTKNGQNVEIWNADGGTCSEQSYKCVPLYLSSRGYGVFVNSTEKVSFEVCSETVSKVSFTLPGEELEYFIFGGDTIAQVMEGYTTLTGKPALPPAFSFGLWLTSSFCTSYDEKTVTSFIDGMAQRDIPLQVFHFDCFWMKGFEWCGFEWDKEQFPDPEGMLKRLHEDKGVKTCVWINPYVGQHSKLFDEGLEKGYFVRRTDGSVFQCDEWQPGLAIVDFTNPDACQWYASHLRELCRMGIDTFKTDFGERIPTRDILYFDGSDPVKMHNYYTYLYNQCVYNVLKEYYGENKACVFARSATAGCQQFPVHWGGDCSATYSSMAEVIRGCLSLCISGFGYTSHDMAGFESTATPDIYKRWAAFGLLSTHSRLHGNQSYRVPWLFDEESCDVLRFFTKLKGRLMPYLWSQAIKTHTTGITMMRAMAVDFTHDPACLTLDRQYMLGDDLLVSPILNEEGIAQYYVPEGRWTDIITGKVFEGGRWHTHKCSYFEIPALAKPGSIIAYGDFTRDFEYNYLDNTEFVIYEPVEDVPMSCRIYDTDANEVFVLEAVKKNGRIEISCSKTSSDFTVRVAGTDNAVTINPTSSDNKAFIDL